MEKAALKELHGNKETWAIVVKESWAIIPCVLQEQPRLQQSFLQQKMASSLKVVELCHGDMMIICTLFLRKMEPFCLQQLCLLLDITLSLVIGRCIYTFDEQGRC